MYGNYNQEDFLFPNSRRKVNEKSVEPLKYTNVISVPLPHGALFQQSETLPVEQYKQYT